MHPVSPPARPSPPPPTKRLAEGYSDGLLPFGLDAQLELRGGRAAGVKDRIGCAWNAEFLAAVDAGCRRQAACGRDWFRLDAMVLTGPTGSGRTHVARRLAWHAGVPHLPIDVGGEAGAWALGAGACGPTPPRPSALAIAVAACGCANPVIDVSGVSEARDGVLARLAAAIDPMNGRLDDEALGAVVDLSEATWLVQLPVDVEPPAALLEVAAMVALVEPGGPEQRELAWIETLAELALDRGVDLAAGPTDWIGDLLSRAAPDTAAERYRRAGEALDAALTMEVE